MAEGFIQFAFSSGVLSEAFLSRPDLEKFDLGLRTGKNWLIDYRGGASVRPPLEFKDHCLGYSTAVRIEPFQFNSNILNTYLMIFGHEYVVFMQDGEYITETAKTVASMTAADPAVITSTAHGFANGDWVKFAVTEWTGLNEWTFQVSNVTANTFRINKPDGTAYSTAGLTAWGGSGTVSRIYKVTTPYASTALKDLVFDQFRDEVNITSTDYHPRKLTRLGATNWTLAETNFEGNTVGPTPASLSLTPWTIGSHGAIYGITAVNQDDQESPLTAYKMIDDTADFTVTTGSVRLEWGAVAGVKEYRIYRSILGRAVNITAAQSMGYLGRAYGPQFSDDNIIPDFTKPPPVPDNPFADEAVLSISITAAGTGYTQNNSSVAITGGTGFRGVPVVNNAGEIIAVRIITRGEGYAGGTLTFSSATGSGATATFTTSPSSGNWPQCSARVAQRRIYGGTINLPMNIFASVPGLEQDFSTSLLNAASDAFDLSLDSNELTPIKYIIPASIGFFVFTESNVFQVRGADDSLISASTIIAERKSKLGIGRVPPVQVSDVVLFLNQNSLGVHSLSPSNLPNYFQLKDHSIYSSQYFTSENQVVSWTHAANPDRVMWAARENGTFLSMTFVPEQNIFAWTDHATEGFVESVATVREGTTDKVYAVVNRLVDGQFRRYIEAFDTSAVKSDEDMWSMDSAVVTKFEPKAGNVRPTAASGDDIFINASTSVFSVGDVGKHIRASGGRYLVTEYISATQVKVDTEIAATVFIPETTIPRADPLWTMEAKVSTIGRLHHLEGMTVQVFGDGDLQAAQVVTDGEITLAAEASFVAVGLHFDAELTTLPLSNQQNIVLDKKKRPVDISLRLLNARGLQASALGSNRFYDLKDRTYEDYLVPTKRQTGIREIGVVADWSEDAGFIIRKDKALKATVLGFVQNVEIGLD